ncbi:hypothetical protein NLI96_g12899 [Meripilus lineatus]|uniref:Integrase catalytic domain-containing protein n=1 Tax=Meripilus lineatus TaxID=2056292 RepID=A0AAD5UQS5_9APHY|nr:hypothetical protein NLI96_g12899 [Physisporinus lineatus]
MSSATDSYRIKALDGSDTYPIWRVQMQDILTDMNLWDYVTGTQKQPTEAAGRTSWTTSDRKALTAIRLRIAGTMMTYVMNATTSKQAWDSLSEMFHVQGPIAQILARRKLLRYMIDEGAQMEEEIRKMRGWKEQLSLLNHQIDDKEFALTILTALPESWDSFIGSIDASDLKSTTIIGRILAEDARRKSRTSGTTALVATTKPSHQGNRPSGSGSGSKSNQFRSNRGKSKFRPGVYCHHCKKEGHIRPECRGLMRSNQSNQPKDSSQSHIATDEYAFATLQSIDSATDLWIGDSGTQSHICKHRELFETYTPTPNRFIKGAGRCPSLGRGTVRISFIVDGKHIPITLLDVIHAPEMPQNLISFGRLTNAGLSWYGIDDEVTVCSRDKIIARGHKIGNLYAMDVATPVLSHVARTLRTWYEWHCALGHLNRSQLRDLVGLSHGLDVDTTSDFNFICEPCILAKQSRRPFPPVSETKYQEIGEMTYSDIWGPARTESIHRNTYFISFTDAASRFTAIYFMKSRAAALDRFQKYRNFIKLQKGKDLKKLRVDNAKEYTEGEFRKFLDKEGIICEPTAPYSPAQNGVAERLNRTLVEHARAMLLAKKLPKFLWEDAVAYANFLRNRSPTRSLERSTPFEAFWGKRPDLQNIQEFGIDCWVLIPDSKRSKLEAKS